MPESQAVLATPLHAMSSSSSACSTASSARRKFMYSKVPDQPDENDAAKWSKFLAAYQNGDWDSTNTCQSVCTKTARKVHTNQGDVVDSQEFFKKNKYLAAPPAPREKCKLRDETLTRYGLHVEQEKACVDRYVKHAKRVFRCDYASISVACTTRRAVQFLASEGGAHNSAATATNTLCDHAMLLGEDDIFVVPDLMKD